MALLASMVSCSGTDGDPGAPGPAGPAGPAGTPGSSGTSGTTGQSFEEVRGTGQLHMVVNGTGVTTYTLVPGMMTTIDGPDDAFLSVTVQGGSYLTNGQSAGNIAKGALGIFLDGTLVSESEVWQYVNSSDGFRPWNIVRALNATSGTHQIELRGRLLETATAGIAFSFDGTEPILQAVMTIVVLRR